MARYIAAVIDLQYGSTGKGQIAGTVALKWKPDTVATAWGPNAGHTFCHEGFQGVSRMLASSATAPSIHNVLVGPGSVVDTTILAKEIVDRGRRHLEGKNLIIHPQAVIWAEKDMEAEAVLLHIGSTMKGTAEAAIRKIRRQANTVAGQCTHEVIAILGPACFEAGMSIVVSSHHYDRAVDLSERLILEGAQGFSLGLHTDFYPRCTGRDVSTAQLFADCRIPWPNGYRPAPYIIGTARTYPIRVSNRYKEVPAGRGGNGDGKVMVGSSGGCYPDQEEITWESINRPAELTTVTRLPRRVFSFSHDQIRAAARVCSPSAIALTFCDYLADEQDALRFAKEVRLAAGVPVKIMSFGPDTSNVKMVHLDNTLEPMLDSTAILMGAFD